MEKEKMLVTEALNELKTLDARINRAISQADFIEPAKNKDPQVVPGVTKEEFKKKADASYTSINDLILRRKKIKAAILNSNAVTKINMHEKEMTIAEVIDLKGMIVYYKSLLNKMITQRDISVAKVNVNNSKVEAYIDKMVSDAYNNKDGKNIIKPEEYAAIADPYRERNEWVLVDPLGITEKIESLQNFIEEFESTVDSKLQISNCITFIEF